jgi:twitching motility protein PilT
MDLNTFNQFLGGAVSSGASDIHFKVGVPPAVRVSGELRQVRVPALRPDDTEQVARHILDAALWQGDMSQLREEDTSYALAGVGRFRASVFRQRGSIAVILRSIPMSVPSLDALGLPPVMQEIAAAERGMVLVTGVTGSGKTSTLAGMVDYINQNTSKHIITIEDPIEYLHKDNRARITQREIGPDSASFSAALRSALRQDPDVILVGEMRDIETIDIALKAAETGHLLLSTAHTTDVAKTINRVVGAYPSDAERTIRGRLSEALKAIISQRLLPRVDGQGRAVAAEIMVNNVGIQDLIRDPVRTKEIPTFLEKGHDVYGTQSFDQCLANLFRGGVITMETAKEAASNASDFERAMHFS